MNHPQRLHSLDNLRAIMMWLGIVLHVAVNHYQGEFSLPWRDPQTSDGASVLFWFIHAFRMPVFFVVAGFFVALLVEKQGRLGMLKHRLRRLGLPFLVFWPPLFLLAGLLVMRYLNLMADAGTGLGPGQGMGIAAGAESRPVTTLHLWFMYYLMWFCGATAVVAYLGGLLPASVKSFAAALGRRISTSWWSALVLTVPLALIGSFYTAGIVRVSGSFIPQPGEFFHYGLFYLFGWILYRNRAAALDWYGRFCWRFFAAGLLLFVLSLALFTAVRQQPEQIQLLGWGVAIVYNGTSWLWSMALIGMFVRYLPGQNRLLAYIADSSYWVYLIHMLCTIGFGVLLYNAPLGVAAKMAINIAATTAVCLISYHVLVRYSFIATFLNGRKHEYKGKFTPVRIGAAVAALFIAYLGLTQIKFAQNDAPVRASAPAGVTVPPDVAAFLEKLGLAYGSADSAEVGRFLASDFLHQGMDKSAFLDHLQKNQRYLGRLAIVPTALQADSEATRLIAYANAPKGVLPPSLQLLPLHAGAGIVKEHGEWKLRGNQKRTEAGLYKEHATVLADFEPGDLEAYRRLIPPGFSMPQSPYVRVSVTQWRDMEPPQTPYRLSQLSILVNKEGNDIWHLVAMPETDWLAVEAGKSVGFPKFVADVDIRRSFGNAWKTELRRQDRKLAEIHFDPVLMTKTTQLPIPNNTDDWLVLGKDGFQQKALMNELAPPLNQKSGYGWMTVTPHASPWTDLLAPGSRAAAVSTDARGPRKLHLYALNDVAVPPEIRQTLDRVAEAFSRQDMASVLENYHPAFTVTNQRDMVAMRRLFSMSRRYEWRVRDVRLDGEFAWIKGEVMTEIGAFPLAARLLKEQGRWVFFGDGGSLKDREVGDPAINARDARPGEFEAFARKEAVKAIEAADDLRFDRSTKELWGLATIGNAIFKPAGSGPFPALVLLHGCSGRLGPGMRNWIDAALKQGYVVMAVDSMRGQATNCTIPLRVPLARRVKDAYDALEHLRKMPMVDPKRIAVAGFSQGGMVALLLASKEFSGMFQPRHRFAAVAAVYPLCYMSARYSQYDMHFLRQDTDLPLQVLMGGEDNYTAAYDCMFGLKKLQARGAPVEWHVFPKAGHAWDTPEFSGGRTMNFRGDMVAFSYDREVTAESRRMLFDFLERRMNKLQEASQPASIQVKG